MDLLRHLRYFVAVADELHFGRAAERLHMAQPPLSQRIRALERELGLQLFVRTSRRVSLTPAGRVLVVEARRLLAGADELRLVMRQVRDGGLGELRAGLPHDVGAPVLAGLLRRFRALCPDVRLDVREETTAAQTAALAEGTLDVGVLTHPVADGRLATGPVLARPLGVLLPAGSGLARGASVELGDLGDRPLALFPRESAPETFDDVLATCGAYGFVPEEVRHVQRRELAVALVMAGEAVALTHEPADDDAVAWRPLSGSPLALAVSTAWRTGDANGAIGAFTDATVATLERDGGWVPAAPPPPPSPGAPPRPSSGVLS